jgi:hypothetical protein
MAGRINRRTKQQQEVAAQRRPKVYALRIAGVKFDDIARQMGISPGQACLDFHEALAEWRAQHEQEAEDARATQATRLEALITAHWAKALQGDVAATKQVRACIETLGDFYGLKAPVKQEVTGADGGPITISAVSAAREAVLSRLTLLAERERPQLPASGTDG